MKMNDNDIFDINGNRWYSLTGKAMTVGYARTEFESFLNFYSKCKGYTYDTLEDKDKIMVCGQFLESYLDNVTVKDIKQFRKIMGK